jgi:hypothetical protein
MSASCRAGEVKTSGAIPSSRNAAFSACSIARFLISSHAVLLRPCSPNVALFSSSALRSASRRCLKMTERAFLARRNTTFELARSFLDGSMRT